MIQKPKGTYDVFGKKGKDLLYIHDIIQVLMEKYNYEYMRTPIFESSELYHRGVGETTDIVSKETYDFKDRGDRFMTLRPEGTAGIVRSYIENKMYGNASQPIKSWYYGPMFRYERPQAGRYRELNQFGVEVFGSNDPLMDAEVISIPVNLYKILGLKGIKVNINTLGDIESRLKYREALLEYFKPHLDSLCEDCRNRYETNPLRILDCKVDHELDIMKNAPKISEYLNETSINHFNKVKEYLESMGIDYVVNENLVRGLDYYTKTVFEFVNKEGLTLCGGGRYDNLVHEIDEKLDIPSAGFGMGLERILYFMELQGIDIGKPEPPVLYVGMMGNVTAEALRLIMQLRSEGITVETDYLGKSVKAQMKYANKIGARYVVIIGENELESGKVKVKNMLEGYETECDITDIKSVINR